jgi:HNH endonuclease
MRSEARKKLKIVLIEDSHASKDPIAQLLASQELNRGSESEPVRGALHGEDCWVYKGRVFQIEGADTTSEEEIKLRIKHEFVRHMKEVQRIRREVEAFENFEKLPSARRERIPESVRMFVWQRDGGQCIECGSKENLEFDHIIPVVEGGATTERNVQLLCEACNRKKGRKI